MAEIPQQTCRIAGRTVVATGAHWSNHVTQTSR